MARASIPTLLSLDHYAKIMGLDALHFCQGVSRLRANPSCPQVWYQYTWQNPSIVSREHLSEVIAEAEKDLADAIGYWPTPVWLGGATGEEHRYTPPKAPGAFGLGSNVYGRYKSLQLNRGYVIEGGQRGTTSLGDACWIGLDLDGDGFYETASFTLEVDAGLDPCSVHAYFKEYEAGDAANSRTDPASAGADEAWEVRPLQVSLTGTTLTIYTKAWNLFRPQLWEELAPDLEAPIDADDFGVGGVPTDPCALGVDLGSYVDGLTFYRVYNDPENQVEFVWGGDISCSVDTACAEATQAGCLRVKNARNGLVIPRPGTYNADTGSFTSLSWTQSIEPDLVRVWYRAGWTPERPRTCQVLSDYWAKIITMLATARLEWDLCDCTNVKETSDYWRQDASKMTRDKSFNLSQNELSNPFGQKVGEVLAWRRITKSQGRKKGQAIRV